MVPLVAKSDADAADAGVPRQVARVAVVPVLLLEVFAGAQEGALLFWPSHILGIVCLTVIKHFLLVALEKGLFALLVSF